MERARSRGAGGPNSRQGFARGGSNLSNLLGTNDAAANRGTSLYDVVHGTAASRAVGGPGIGK